MDVALNITLGFCAICHFLHFGQAIPHPGMTVVRMARIRRAIQTGVLLEAAELAWCIVDSICLTFSASPPRLAR
ncbi:hypothetical protein BDY17DRAFT_303697 [Neohortaea acidophila]|uniref:Uncharacterized protein n=1 Tax=Neohortaea acidophila TaxID=245834 RepID=A0A6A6PH73_9PEZI|nr:uncharacterized protein BDY17DRAFT_303697 [Neohortaea acidophila]KAF2479340.1 hypothetical protein BDY17DRAFT_303697 [Neohortaea acidophila]